VPTTPEVAPEPLPEKTEKGKRASKKKADEKGAEKSEGTPQEKPVKKTAKKSVKKAEKTVEVSAVKAEEAPAEIEEAKAEISSEPKTETPVEEKNDPVPDAKNEPKAEVMDMSFLFGTVKPAKTEPKEERKAEESAPKKAEAQTEKSAPKTEQKPAQAIPKAEEKPQVMPEQKPAQKPQSQVEQKPQTAPKNQMQSRVLKTVKQAAQKPMSAEEKLRDNFLKKLRSLGGDYFEYYSVYLLEKYSRKNGRRLEALKVSGGERDGGIDGEIELTDRLGFRETIYIQSKNWDPQRGDERLWVVGETLLQQFIGACACKQAKDGKQHTRGIFITTSNFTPDAKRILDTMSDKVVGYDGNDVFDAAKECQFGLIYENGNWKLDEKLLSGTKAFFNMM
jgi:restriction endonuclease Mrr